MENNESDWEEVNPEELGGDRPGEEAEEKESSQQSLTPKVLDLMEKISEYGYLTMHEVQLIFGNKTWAYKVMKGLRKEGFIADHDTLMSPRTAHYLTPKGYRVLVKLGRLKVGWRFKPERYSVFIFRHRMACAKVGLLLEKHPLVHEFLPESRLFKRRKNQNDKLCDGEFWYKVQGHEPAERVGLEVELTLKSKPQLEETFRELGRRDDLDQVWWICAEENIRRAMRREVQRRYLGSQRHFFALLEEFLAVKGKADLMEPQGALLSIDPGQPTLLPRPIEAPPQSPTSMPLPSPMGPPALAKAEATPEPQPEPPRMDPPESRPRPRLLVRGRAAWRDLGWESQERIKSLLTGAGILLGLGVAVFFLWGSLDLQVAPPSAQPLRPRPTWRSRPILDKPYNLGAWKVFDFALASKGKDYRLRVNLGNISRDVCTLLGVGVYDDQEQPLYSEAIQRDWVWSRFKWRTEIFFRPSSEAKKVLFVLNAEPSGCDIRLPVDFR